LSATLIEISDRAFADCLSLNTIICYAIEPPTISSNTFPNVSFDIYVPDEAVEAYKAATNWSSMALRIKPLSEYE
jgi:hypothetical protein